MRRPRFTIATLLAFVLFLGVGLAALRAANDPWDSGVLGLTLASLLGSVLLVVHRNGEKRAYWLGFALFGGTYLILSLMPPIESRLPTSRALAYFDSKVSDRVDGLTFAYPTTGVGGSNGKPAQMFAFSVGGSTLTTNSGTSVRLWDGATGRLLAGPNGTSENFLRIGHSLLSLMLAFLGAHLSRYLHTSGRRESDDVK